MNSLSRRTLDALAACAVLHPMTIAQADAAPPFPIGDAGSPGSPGTAPSGTPPK